MSAFIVSNDTIDHFVHMFAHPEAPAEELDLIGRELLLLNAEAVAERYRDTVDLDIVSQYRTRLKHFSASLVQQYKSLQCWLYQCSEGERFENHPLYKKGQQIAVQLAERIVSALPEYNAAKWSA